MGASTGVVPPLARPLDGKSSSKETRFLPRVTRMGGALPEKASPVPAVWGNFRHRTTDYVTKHDQISGFWSRFWSSGRLIFRHITRGWLIFGGGPGRGVHFNSMVGGGPAQAPWEI